MTVSTAVFYLIALLTIVSAGMVAFSRNIIYSAFSLLGTFMGVAGLYIFLGADFVAAVQVLIYVGGILVLILFAVMLTHRITDVTITNRAAGTIPALIVIGVLVYFLIQTVVDHALAQGQGSRLRGNDVRRSATPFSMTICCLSSWRRWCCWRR